MRSADASDTETLARHRAVWAARPELRRVYEEWFGWLLEAVAGLSPAVEVGSGPGFFKDFAPRLVAIDVTPGARADVRCDACVLPFASGALGALVMVDALHHLPRPLEFMAEAARVLRVGGRLAMLEPWVTPASFVLWRWLHHEGCRLRVDPARPFAPAAKRALDGNAAIPRLVLRRRGGLPSLRLIRRRTFVGLPYLLTFGFQRARPLPHALDALARALEPVTAPLRPLAASRILAVWERSPDGPPA
jgi:SAM-dependent methyltransferase